MSNSGRFVMDPVEELDELLVSMATVRLADHPTALDIECSKQRRRTLANVIVRLSTRNTRAQRQGRLGSIECLNLRLFIDAQHDRTIRGTHVQPDDGAVFVDEQRVRRKLKGLRAVRLQAESSPDTHDRRLREPGRLRHEACTPLRRITRPRLRRTCDDCFDLHIGNRTGRSRPRLVREPIPAIPKKNARATFQPSAD